TRRRGSNVSTTVGVANSRFLPARRRATGQSDTPIGNTALSRKWPARRRPDASGRYRASVGFGGAPLARLLGELPAANLPKPWTEAKQVLWPVGSSEREFYPPRSHELAREQQQLRAAHL